MPEPAKIAGVVLRDQQGRYLAVQEANGSVRGLWNFPGGHVDEGETLQQAAIREAREEVGLEVELLNQEPILISDIPKFGHQYHAFLARIIGGSLKVNKDELLDAQWLSISQLNILDRGGKMRDPLFMEVILKAEAHANPGH